MKERVAIDIETTGLEPWSDIHCIAVVNDDAQRLFTNLDQYMNYMSQLGWPTPIFHNALFDKVILERRGLCPPGGFTDWEDTMLMAYLLHPGCDVSLKTLAKEVGTNKAEKPISFDKYTKQMGLYCLQDAFVTNELYYHFAEKMSKRLMEYYQKVEKPYQKIIEDMELGYYINKHGLAEAFETQHRLISEAEVAFLSHFKDKVKVKKERLLPKRKQNCSERYVVCEDGNFNVAFLTWYADDPNQPDVNCEYHYCEFEYLRATHKKEVVAELLRQGWKPEKFSEKTDEPNLDKAVLEDIKHKFPLAADTRLYGKRARELSAYLEKIDAAPDVDEDFKLLTCSVNQTVTATTRLSMSNPPLQQIPVRDPDSRYIRKLFVPPEGYNLVIGDVSQFELRILAFYLEVYCDDSRMADVIRDGRDMHSENAAAWFGKEFTPEQRYISKGSIFSVLYGAGPKKLSAMLGISHKEAVKLIEAIYETTAIEEYEEIMENMALDNKGVITGIAGNQWKIWEVFSESNDLRAAGIRMCRNYPIQGTQAALMKLMQNRAEEKLADAGLVKYEWEPLTYGNYDYIHPVTADYRNVLQVHDEAHAIVKEEYTELFIDIYNGVFNNTDVLKYGDIFVPIKADFHVCKDWSEKG